MTVVWLTLMDERVHGPAYLTWEAANEGAKALAKKENIGPKRVMLIGVPLENGESRAADRSGK